MKKKCDFQNCNAEGIYPVPKSRTEIDQYIYLCIDHIREFNKSWNYFAGLTDEEFENEIRKSTTWDRPSWKFGTQNSNMNFNDHFNIFKQKSSLNVSKNNICPKLLKSWKTLGLEPTKNINEVKKKYKVLAKKWHPDKNLDIRKNDNDMFVKITNAYRIIIKSFETTSIKTNN